MNPVALVYSRRKKEEGRKKNLPLSEFSAFDLSAPFASTAIIQY
ncbi:hypothetical protein [Okeania sp. SIO2B3]|nr:hypothetical protein [Okeania sp. SIO2B3]